jgi:hypothetical protein
MANRIHAGSNVRGARFTWCMSKRIGERALGWLLHLVFDVGL